MDSIHIKQQVNEAAFDANLFTSLGYDLIGKQNRRILKQVM
jgi:hypothetical protein